ncbi:MAG: glycosyltransferase family 2 protein [Bacteroidaceae bacterium]|nr:glycosyltransferase family 2 protein [Bacteroidaceae bacterium]
MEVAILLTTWNSSRFLTELLDSIMAQTYQDWQLFVRDDGSTDETLTLLHDYKENRAREKMIIMPSEGNLGPKDGFMWLLEHAEADLYMFCDHDDVWLPTKIEDCVQLMMEQPDNDITPLLVCCNLKLVDSNLNVLADDYWTARYYRRSDFTNKWFHLFYNNIPGCVMLINQKAKETVLPYPPEIVMHDAWVVAALLWREGKVLWTERPGILYRQHGGNTIGAGKMPSIFSQLLNIRKLMQKTRQQHRVARELTRMSSFSFIVMKVYYMLAIHIRRFFT